MAATWTGLWSTPSLFFCFVRFFLGPLGPWLVLGYHVHSVGVCMFPTFLVFFFFFFFSVKNYHSVLYHVTSKIEINLKKKNLQILIQTHPYPTDTASSTPPPPGTRPPPAPRPQPHASSRPRAASPPPYTSTPPRRKSGATICTSASHPSGTPRRRCCARRFPAPRRCCARRRTTAPKSGAIWRSCAR